MQLHPALLYCCFIWQDRNLLQTSPCLLLSGDQDKLGSPELSSVRFIFSNLGGREDIIGLLPHSHLICQSWQLTIMGAFLVVPPITLDMSVQMDKIWQDIWEEDILYGNLAFALFADSDLVHVEILMQRIWKGKNVDPIVVKINCYINYNFSFVQMSEHKKWSAL